MVEIHKCYCVNVPKFTADLYKYTKSNIKIIVGGDKIKVEEKIKYLGIIIVYWSNFKDHISLKPFHPNLNYFYRFTLEHLDTNSFQYMWKHFIFTTVN